MGLLDAIWSSVGGLVVGLLPTDEQKETEGKARGSFERGKGTVASNRFDNTPTKMASHL